MVMPGLPALTANQQFICRNPACKLPGESRHWLSLSGWLVLVCSVLCWSIWAGLGVLVSLDNLSCIRPGTLWMVSLCLAPTLSKTVHIQALLVALLMYERMTPNNINNIQHKLGSRYGTKQYSQRLTAVDQAQDTGANLSKKTNCPGVRFEGPIPRDSARECSIYHQSHSFESKLVFGGISNGS